MTERVVKFRCWDNVLKEMIYQSPSLVLRLSGRVTDGSTTPGVNLMQSTGLIDKHGVEIYEGDILRIWDWGQEPEVIGIAAMEWDVDETGWGLMPQLIEDRYDFRQAMPLAEVIGNIHQNPELLTR